MPVNWQFAEDVIRLGGVGANRIAPEDGARQQATARSILFDLKSNPGIVLADEVGMGKTYVALAVVASVVCATRHEGRPVVVMVPPGLAQKWPREWEQFKALCCDPPQALSWVRAEYAHRPTDFFKLIDDPRVRRPHIIWMTTSCFGHGLADPWVKLALVRLARSQTKLDEEAKRKLYKWATSLVRLRHQQRLTPEVVERLMFSDLSRWRGILTRARVLDQDADDPVPQHLLQKRRSIDWTPLTKALRGEVIPGRRGVVSRERLQEARGDFNIACQEVYQDWLSRVAWRAPLLVLDEAHHAKNDETRLAGLFRDRDAEGLVAAGPDGHPKLWEKFDRLLFLTATPFQLGHHELVRVLRSFEAAKWTGSSAPVRSREAFRAAMTALDRNLSANYLSARRLDRLWGKLAFEVVAKGQSATFDAAAAARAWWQRVSAGAGDDPVDRSLLQAIEDCRKSKERAQDDPQGDWSSLRSWVIRHNRSTNLPPAANGSITPRRELRAGGALVADDQGPGSLTPNTMTGLPITGDSALPFLLAARAQGELAHGSAKARAFFAEGLCSSYEAFHHTREGRGDVRDADDEDLERSSRRSPARDGARAIVPVSWYEEQIERTIPSRRALADERLGHPKILPVVERTVDLWIKGEKVLIFCFYRQTARALREHVRSRITQATIRMAATKLRTDRDSELVAWFERVGRRLADPRSPFYQAVVETLRDHLREDDLTILRAREEQLVQLLAAYVRSPSFIARYLPLEVKEVREALSEGSASTTTVRAGARALSRILSEESDASSMSMHMRIAEFLRFAKELAERGRTRIADDGESIDPLDEYLAAIAAPTSAEDEEDQSSSPGTFRAQQPVRMVYGETKRPTREKVMLAFNSPMFPEILISSAVLGEGVDLHRFCRYVIHHDLSWNPSTLEQRTGRLDRIRCRAEITRRPIVIYEPFIAGSADEKMFRVVKDRERWFQIVMGQKYESLDESASEELANRVPLPDDLAHQLVFDLRRFRHSEPAAVSHGI